MCNIHAKICQLQQCVMYVYKYTNYTNLYCTCAYMTTAKICNVHVQIYQLYQFVMYMCIYDNYNNF